MTEQPTSGGTEDFAELRVLATSHNAYVAVQVDRLTALLSAHDALAGEVERLRKERDEHHKKFVHHSGWLKRALHWARTYHDVSVTDKEDIAAAESFVLAALSPTPQPSAESPGGVVSPEAARADAEGKLEAKNDAENSLAAGPISHDEAREMLSRFINSHFNNPGEHARATIPADPRRDDDLRMSAYIKQQRAESAKLAELRSALASQGITILVERPVAPASAGREGGRKREYCACDLRNRQWSYETGICETCGMWFDGPSAVSQQRPSAAKGEE